MLGDEDWVEMFPTKDEPPSAAALTGSQRPEVEELLLSLLVVEAAVIGAGFMMFSGSHLRRGGR